MSHHDSTSPAAIRSANVQSRLTSEAAGKRASRRKASADNDGTCRKTIWRRLEGDSWEAFDALPRAIRLRLTEHVYDAWSVNALALWRHYKKVHGATERAERAMIRYLDYCERLEQQAFIERHGALAHQAAGATPLRYEASRQKMGA